MYTIFRDNPRKFTLTQCNVYSSVFCHYPVPIGLTFQQFLNGCEVTTEEGGLGEGLYGVKHATLHLYQLPENIQNSRVLS